MNSSERFDKLVGTSHDDANHVFEKDKLGLVPSGGRLVIVAEADTTTDQHFWVEAIPTFNVEKTEVLVDFWLVGELCGRRVHATLSPGVAEAALRDRQSVMAAAMLDQYGWLSQNFPAVASIIYEAHQRRITPSAQPSGKQKTL